MLEWFIPLEGIFYGEEISLSAVLDMGNGTKGSELHKA